MRWPRRKMTPTYVPFVHDGITRNEYSASWWKPGCKCHWSAGIEGDYCDPRTTEHYDRARGNLDRHGVHFLTAYVAGV